MNEGEINGIGTHEELLAGNDIYREVYESQNGAGANADFDEEASVATKEQHQDGADDLPPSEGEGAIPEKAPVATKEVSQHA